MDRDSIIYKVRRKSQVIAQMFLPDELMCKLYSKIVLRKKVNLKQPKTFNEKIQWLKLYDYPKNELVIQASDKYRVREYIKSKNLENILVPMINHWESVDAIIWNDLPNEFVIKCNHGCAYNIICDNKETFDVNASKRKIRRWMKEDFGAFNIEKHYSKIKPHIVCEQFLGEEIIDYKFFCFNGKPQYLYISSDLIHDRQAKIGFYYAAGGKMPMFRDDYETYDIDCFPDFYNDMFGDACKLCEDFTFVRVDFFVTKDRYYFAELTFTPSGGMMPFNPEKFDLVWGKILNI